MTRFFGEGLVAIASEIIARIPLGFHSEIFLGILIKIRSGIHTSRNTSSFLRRPP